MKILNNMEKEFVPYELALKLKELGFDERCLAGYYNDGKSLWFFRFHKNSEREPTVAERFATAPLWQQAFDWFRENHRLHVEIRSYTATRFTYVIQKLENIVHYIEYGGINNTFETYEEAREACLEKLIELVENEKN